MTTTPPTRVRLAVITDLHYTQDTTAKPPTFRPQMANGHTFDPMEQLETFVTENNIKADLLLCPGDITNFAAHDAFLAGWDKLKGLRGKLHAEELIAVTGNHEVQSRPPENSKIVGLPDETVDPVGQLQRIVDYPATFALTPDKRWIYWGRGYEVVELADTVIVLINSCHFHTTMQPLEYERGKISDVVLESFKNRITQLALKKKFRIVLMHHHPITQLDEDGQGQNNMYNGARLMEILNESYCDWLIIHGHKHNPRLIRAQGSAGQPIVFSAGSFGAALSGILATKTKNQFYIIDLESTSTPSGGSEMNGRVEAYYWSATEWRPAVEYQHGMPYGCGFASNVDVDSIARDIHVYLTSLPGSFATWTELVVKFPALAYLMPNEISKLKHVMARLKVTLGGDHRHWFPKELSI